MPKSTFSKVLNVSFPEDMFEALAKEAADRSMKSKRFVGMNELVRIAVEKYLAARPRRVKKRS